MQNARTPPLARSFFFEKDLPWESQLGSTYVEIAGIMAYIQTRAMRPPHVQYAVQGAGSRAINVIGRTRARTNEKQRY
jgi:hypothetical protein